MLLRFARLALIAVLAGCGTGISVDPEGIDPPRIDSGDDKAKVQTTDASSDAADARARDGDGASEVGSPRDAPDGVDRDGANAADRAADGSGAADGSTDVARDGSDRSDDVRDGSFDGGPDESNDVFDGTSVDAAPDASIPDVSIDVARDARIDGVGAGDSSRDAADALGDSKDATQDHPRDAAVADVLDACSSVSCWPAADYYVDATAAPGGNGSKLQPFKTITAAVDAHDAAPGVAKKAYVAPGTYDKASGERFPLVLRGLSLEGAGQDRTTILGTGSYHQFSEGGSLPRELTVAVVIGERDLPTSLSGLTIRSESPVPVENYYGVLCNRGNATGEVASPLGQTHLDQVTVGPGFGYDVMVATSTIPTSTGCNMMITRSTITSAWQGVRALGCGSTMFDDPVMLEMGTDDPSSGNTISWITSVNTDSAGVCLQDCLVHGSFHYNTFRDGMTGIAILDTGVVAGTTTRVNLAFTHNVFERLSAYGLQAEGYTLIADEIANNRFRDIARTANQQGVNAIALSMNMFVVGKVRGNEFIGNDNGIVAKIWDPSGTPADLGTVADPGNNVFRCNSAPDGAGGDVLIAGNGWDPDQTWTGTLRLAGNAWDHAPPTLLTLDPPPNGVDISLLYSPQITVDRQNGTLSTVACPSGRVPGQ